MIKYALLKILAIYILAFSITPAAQKSDLFSVEGFVPQGVSPAYIAYEYGKIYEKLAPGQKPSRSPLYVIYFSKRAMPQSAFWLPEWGGGGAIGADTIVVAVDARPLLEQDLRVTTVHELVHIVIKRITPGARIPRWFHEGTALLLSGDITWSEQVSLSQALFGGALLAMDSIDQVNSFGPLKARLAYAQSRQGVKILVDTYGIGVLPEILEAADSSGSFSSALYSVLGLTDEELETMIHAEIRKRFNLVLWLVDSYFLWIGIVLLFLIGFIVTRIRNRKKSMLMEREESLSEQDLTPENQ